MRERSPNDAERRRRRSHAGLVQGRDCLGNPVGTRPRDQTSPKRQRGFRLRWLSSPAHPPGASKSGWHPLVDMLNGLPAPSSLYSRCAESEKSLTQNLQFVDFFVATSYATKRKKKWKIFRAVRRFRPGGGRICSSRPDVPSLGGRSVAVGQGWDRVAAWAAAKGAEGGGRCGDHRQVSQQPGWFGRRALARSRLRFFSQGPSVARIRTALTRRGPITARETRRGRPAPLARFR